MSSKQLTQRRNFLTPDNQTAFLLALADRKLNVTAACRAAGLASTSGVYEQRKIDPEFARRWQEIEEELLDSFEEKQMEAAERGNEDRRWVLSRRRAGRWSERNAHLSVKAEVEHRVSVKELSREDLMRIINGPKTPVEPLEVRVVEDAEIIDEETQEEPEAGE